MQYQGSLADRYRIYVECCSDGNGKDKFTGEPIKSFDEWLNS